MVLFQYVTETWRSRATYLLQFPFQIINDGSLFVYALFYRRQNVAFRFELGQFSIHFVDAISYRRQ